MLGLTSTPFFPLLLLKMRATSIEKRERKNTPRVRGTVSSR